MFLLLKLGEKYADWDGWQFEVQKCRKIPAMKLRLMTYEMCVGAKRMQFDIVFSSIHYDMCAFDLTVSQKNGVRYIVFNSCSTLYARNCMNMIL